MTDKVGDEILLSRTSIYFVGKQSAVSFISAHFHSIRWKPFRSFLFMTNSTLQNDSRQSGKGVTHPFQNRSAL